MKGTSPLNNTEIRLVSACFDGPYEHRNRGLFMLGVSTGGRISEFLRLMIGNVYQNRAAGTNLLFEKFIVKDSREAIENLITWHQEKSNATHGSRPLFLSRHQSGTVQMHRQPHIRC